MKKAWRRFLAGICTVSLLMTSTGISVMADEDESIFADLSEDVSVIEQSDTEEQEATPDEEEDNFDVIYEEEAEESQDSDMAIPSQDMDISDSIEESISDESLTNEEEILDQSVAEEVVGDVVSSMDWTYINPVYDHLITEEDLKPLNNEAEDSGDWYIDSLKVRFFVRDQMEARADTIAVHYRTTDDYSQGQTMYRLMEGFVRAETVASYTGRGDYLLFHLAGWKGHISVFPSDDGYYNYTMTYAMTYFTDIAQENEVTEEVNRLINSWNLYEKSTYEKVKIVYDYLVQNVTFSSEFTFEDSSAYAALINKYADCYGFYSAMCRILQECSVDIRAITGKNNIGTDNEAKCAWNAVKIGSRYFNADPALEAEYYSDDQEYSYFLTKEDTSGTFHFQDEYLGGYRRYVSPFSETDYVALEKPPVWIWSQDCSTATVTFNEGLSNEISLSADVSSKILDDSKIIYTATVLFNGEDFSTTTTREVGDEYGAPVWEWEGYYYATAVFTNNSSGETLRKTAMADSKFQISDENTGAGTMTYTVTVSFGGEKYSDSKTIDIVQKTYICSTREEIIQRGRETFRNHETRVMLLWPENIGITLDDIGELREGIYDHTGNPLEGDYLRGSTYSSTNWETDIITKDGIEYYKWVIENCYYTTLEQENELSQWIDNRITSFGFTNATTEFEKFITIYDYIWDNTRYDFEFKMLSNTAYSAGINGIACCQGYSNLLYRMLLEVGIDCRVITGKIDGIIITLGEFALPTTRHSWNIVRIGDLYYETDLTFDQGYSRDESSPYAYLTYDNCLRASLKQHVRDEEYNTEEFKTTYPMSDLSYPVVEKYSVGEGVTCNVEDGVLYINGTGKIKDIHLNVENRPWTTHIRKAVIEEGVSEIGDCVFIDGPDEFKEVVIAGSVKVIGENSFAFCQELEAVDIGEGVRKIEDGAFLCCDRKLTRIEIPGTVREIGVGAFQGCNKLSEVELNDGIRIIEEHAFFTETEDSLTQITIPGSVIEIGNQAFGYYLNEEGSHTTRDPIPGFKIYGYDGSAAETYAEQNGFEFISLGPYAKRDISTCSVSLHDTEIVYDGAYKRPEVIVKDGDDILEKKYDYTITYKNNINAGTAEVLIKGVGQYGSMTTKTFTISPASIDSATVSNIQSETYTGFAQTQNPRVNIGGKVLTEGIDYILSYADNINAGTASMMITGEGNYKGTIGRTFTIRKAHPVLTFASAAVSKTTLDEAFTNKLTKVTDGTVIFESSNSTVATVNETSGIVTIRGVGTTEIVVISRAGANYKKGDNRYTLTVTDGRKDISECSIMLSETSYTYNGRAIKPAVTVKDGNAELRLNSDYYVSYMNNKDAGTATAVVTGAGIYKGERGVEFTISKASPVLTFDCENISTTMLNEPFTISLTKTTDGTVTFNSSDESLAAVDSKSGLVTIKGVGTATITASAAEGTNYKAGSASYKLRIYAMSIKEASVGGLSRSYGYSGKAYTPAVTVKVNGVTLVKDVDFAVKYENNIEPGTATITISGIGNYTGTRIRTFEIVDCVSKVESGKTYQLIPKNNSSTAVSSFGGRMVNNTKVYITDRSSSEAMKFKAVRNTDGTWKFINAKCDLALAVQQNSSSLGAGLVLYDQTTKTEQNWKLSKKSDNSFAIMNAVTGYSIAMSDSSAARGTTLSMAETASNGLQRFYLVETDPVKVAFSGTKTVRASKDKNFGLNIASSSKTDGANVNLYKYSNVNAKKFKILYSGGGYYRLVNVNSGLVLTVKGNTKTSGANVIQSKWAGESGQRWKITKNSDGTVTLKNALGTVLHLNGNKAANGTNVLAKSAATTGAQKWYLQ